MKPKLTKWIIGVLVMVGGLILINHGVVSGKIVIIMFGIIAIIGGIVLCSYKKTCENKDAGNSFIFEEENRRLIWQQFFNMFRQK